MTLRNAVFTGAAGAAWPALDNGDTWDAGFFASAPSGSSTTPVTTGNANIQSNPAATVTGASVGQISAEHRLAPRVSNLGAVYTTAASSSSRYVFSGLAQGPLLGNVTVVCVSTSWTAQHQHVVNPSFSTGSWASMTYNRLTYQNYSWGAGLWSCLSIFVCVNSTGGVTSGNLAVDIQDLAGVAISTQATGGTLQLLSVLGADTSGNGVNAINAANTTTGFGSTGQPSLTWPNLPATYASQGILFCGHQTTNTSSGDSANARTVSSGSYSTPSIGVAVMKRLMPNVMSTSQDVYAVLLDRTMTANFATATSNWGAIAIEIKHSANTAGSYTDRSRDYAYIRLAGNAVQPAYQTSEVRSSWSAPESATDPHHGLVGRYVVSGGTKYWLSTSLVLDNGKQTGIARIYATTDNGTTSSTVSVAATSGSTTMSGVNRQAMRVRVLSSGDLWVSAKYWNSGSAEPAWPALSTDASTSSANSFVVNGVYSTSDPLRNATSGQVGLLYLYPATATDIGPGPGTGFNSWFINVADGVNTTSWTAWSNDAWVISASATATGVGTMTASAVVPPIVTATAAMSGTGSMTGIATGSAVEANAALTGTGSLSATPAVTRVASAALTGVGALTPVATRLTFADGTMSGAGALSPIATRLALTSATLAGSGAMIANGVGVTLGSASLSGSGATSASGVTVKLTQAALTGTGAVSAQALRFAIVAASLSGSGSASASAIATRMSAAALSGSGSLSANPVLVARAQSALSGSGSLSLSALLVMLVNGAMTGSGSLSARAFRPGGTVQSAITQPGTAQSATSAGAGGVASAVGPGAGNVSGGVSDLGTGATSAVGGVGVASSTHVLSP